MSFVRGLRKEELYDSLCLGRLQDNYFLFKISSDEPFEDTLMTLDEEERGRTKICSWYPDRLGWNHITETSVDTVGNK